MRPRRRGESGETLLELLITVMILGTAIVSVLAGIAVAVNSSDESKKDVGVEVVLRDYAEAVIGFQYLGCPANGQPYNLPVTFPYKAPSGYALSTPVSTGCYDPANDTYGGAVDKGAVRLRLEAHSTDSPSSPHFRTKTLEIVKSADYVRPS